MTTSYEEAMKEAAAAQKAVGELREKWDIVCKQRDDLLVDLTKARRRMADLEGAEASLRKELEGFAALKKALVGIKVEGVTAEQVREIVRTEMATIPIGPYPTDPASVVVTETIPNIDLKVSRPWLTLDESTDEGKITVLALKGKLPQPFTFADVTKGLKVHYAWGPRPATVQKALDALVGKFKTLERAIDTGKNQAAYSLRADAKSRVRETETRETVEAKANGQ